MKQEDIIALNDIERIIAVMDRPKLTAEQEYWQGQARKLADSEKMNIVIVGGGWIGPESIANKWGYDVIYKAEYVGGVE